MTDYEVGRLTRAIHGTRSTRARRRRSPPAPKSGECCRSSPGACRAWKVSLTASHHIFGRADAPELVNL